MSPLSPITVVKHFLVWIGLVIYTYFFNSINESPVKTLIFSTLFIGNFASVYYFLQFLIFPLAQKSNLVLVIFGYISAYVLLVLGEVIIFKIIFPNLGIHTIRISLSAFEFLLKSAYWFFFIAVISYANLVLKMNVFKSKKIQRIKSEILNVELGILKNQFHSHLTFNFMNFCYTQLIEISEPVAEAVEHYSEMLHYTLRISGEKSIAIKDEIKYLENFIALQTYLTNKICIRFILNVDSSDYKISPMLFGIIAENAFRNGILNDENQPIDFELTLKGAELKFTVIYYKDKKNQFSEVSDSMMHLKESITLLYPENSSFEIFENESFYRSKLQLKLNECNQI